MNYVIYNRVSTEEQSDFGVSLPAMEASCRAYITSQGGQLVKIYTDSKSGATINRPHLQELLTDVRDKLVNVDVVLVWRLDRLSRNQIDTLKIIDFLSKHKVSFKSVTEPFDTSTPIGQAILGVLSTFAQFERKSIGQRTKNAMASKAKQKRMGGCAPFGYMLPEDGLLSPDPKESKIVKFIFKEYQKGKSLRDISGKLGKKGVATRRGASFRPETVRRILHNPTYSGTIIWDRDGQPVKADLRHKAIVKPSLFELVQQRLSDERVHSAPTYDEGTTVVETSVGVNNPDLYLDL